MLIAVVGPDRSGKTTLFNALRQELRWMRPVPSVPFHRSLMDGAYELEKHYDNLWRALYDDRQCYLCDRWGGVDSPVYAELYNREHLRYDDWVPCVRLLYMRPGVMLSEDSIQSSSLYTRCVELYDKEVEKFQHIRLDTLWSEHQATAKVQVERWCFDANGKGA